MALAVGRADTSLIYSSIQLQRHPKIKMSMSNVKAYCHSIGLDLWICKGSNPARVGGLR